MMSKNSSGRNEFTGKHMLAIMCAFFGVIIADNLTMATFARTSWSGLVVQNSYVAGQEINAKLAEGRYQTELGWSADIALGEGVLRFSLVDAQGESVALDGGVANLRRPVGDADDMSVTLVAGTDGLEAPVAVADGAWIIEIRADVAADKAREAGLDHPYRETKRVQLRGGMIK